MTRNSRAIELVQKIGVPRPSTELKDILAQLGLEKDVTRLADNGFEDWDTVLDVRDHDLCAVNLEPMHIQILKRELSFIRSSLDSQNIITKVWETC